MKINELYHEFSFLRNQAYIDYLVAINFIAIKFL